MAVPVTAAMTAAVVTHKHRTDTSSHARDSQGLSQRDAKCANAPARLNGAAARTALTQICEDVANFLGIHTRSPAAN